MYQLKCNSQIGDLNSTSMKACGGLLPMKDKGEEKTINNQRATIADDSALFIEKSRNCDHD